MPAEFIVDDGNTTIRLEFTTTTEEVQRVVGNAAHYLWDLGKGDHGSEESPIVFDDLTNQDKLNIVAVQVRQEIKDKADTYKSVAAQTLARETEAESPHTL